MSPCEKGLDAECFKSHPEWAKRVFAYRLLHTLFPGEITKRLPNSVRFPPLPPGVVIPPGAEFPPGTFFPPGFVWPPGWLPGDPLPPGAIPPPDLPSDYDGGSTPDYLDPSIFIPPPSRTPPLLTQPTLITGSFVTTSSDGLVRYNHANWNTCHDAGTGDTVSTSMKFYPDVVSVHAPPVLFLIARSFLFFDLSSLSSSFTVDSCTLVVYGNSTGDSTVCIQEGTQADPMTTADFDSFTGSIFDSIVWPPPWEPTYQEITFSLNSTGIAYIQSMLGSTAKICIRNYQYDFLDVEFPDDINAFRAYMAYRENDTELWHPTLNITYEE